MKSFEETKEIPIIFITALADVKNKLHGFEVEAVDYVTKPLQYTEVLAHIQTHLAMRRLQNDLRAQNLLLQQEIIQRKQAEEKLHQRTLDLQARNEELDAFARTVAHDIKSPLNTVIGYAELLQEETQLPSELDRFVQNIINSSYQISNITNGLLFLTRLRTTEPTLEPLDMTEIVLRSQSRLNHLLEKYQADIRMLDQWPISLGYDSWVEEVWRSYLSNALKYGG